MRRPGTRGAAGVLLAVFAAACCLSCPNPAAAPKGGTAKGTLSIAVSASGARTVAAASADFDAAIATLDVAVSDGGGIVAQETGVAFAGGVIVSFGSLEQGPYTVSVNAYSAGAVLIATGSAAVALTAGATAAATVPLAFAQGAATGGFALSLSWPLATGLAYLRATLDGVALPDPTVTAGAAYTATVASAALAGGVHALRLYFKTAAGATTELGPYQEAVNVWDGTTSTRWIDAAGNAAALRAFAAADFAVSGADLADLAFTGASLTSAFAAGTASYGLTGVDAGGFSFAATAASSSQDVAYTWNGVAQAWADIGPTLFASAPLVWNPGLNTLRVTVTAPDRQSSKTYTATFTMLNAANLATALAADLEGSFELTGSIDTTGAGDWTPVGSFAEPFRGTFDGNGHTIRMKSSSSADYIGLFGVVGPTGKISDLKVETSLTACGSFAGALAGSNAGTIDGCSSSGNIDEVAAATFVGGIVGSNTGTLTGCSSSVTINVAANWAAGVVAGKNTGTVRYCWANGAVIGTGYAQIGGLVGHNDGFAALIDQCFSSSGILGTASSGGLVGQNTLGVVSSCYSTGSAIGTDYVGALVGISDGIITRCYTAGTGTNGALLGYNQGATVTDCFYDATIQALSDGGTGAPTAAMKTAATFTAAGWDFTTVWDIDAAKNNGYPILRYLRDHTAAYP